MASSSMGSPNFRVDLLELGQERHHFVDRFLHDFPNGLSRVQLRLLLEIADGVIRG